MKLAKRLSIYAVLTTFLFWTHASCFILHTPTGQGNPVFQRNEGGTLAELNSLSNATERNAFIHNSNGNRNTSRLLRTKKIMSSLFRKLFKTISISEQRKHKRPNDKDHNKGHGNSNGNDNNNNSSGCCTLSVDGQRVSLDELITFGYLPPSSVTTATLSHPEYLQQQQFCNTTSYFPIHTIVSDSPGETSSSSPHSNLTQHQNYNAPVSVVIDSCSSSIVDWRDEGEGDGVDYSEWDSEDDYNNSCCSCRGHGSGVDDGRRTVVKLKINQKILQNTLALNYCSRGLCGLNATVFTSPSMRNLEKLQLCCNAQLQKLPEEICLLRRLRMLNLAGCGLTELPESIGYLQNLEELSLNGNRLNCLPASISGLQRLRKLNLAENEFSVVPRCVLQLNRRLLTSLQVDGNPKLRVVPSEIAHFSQLSRFHVEGCTRLVMDQQQAAILEQEMSATHPPSLKECAARSLIRHHQPVLLSLPGHLKEYLAGADWCSFCQGPMLDARVIRYRQIKRMERIIPVIDELCCAHWSASGGGSSRITCLLSPLPKTTPPDLLGNLETDGPAFVPFNRFNPQVRAIGMRILARFSGEERCSLMVPLSLIVPYPEYPKHE